MRTTSEMPEALGLTLLSCQTHAFLFDFDGTLVELQPRPELVSVPIRLIGQLDLLYRLTNGAVAIVTGRELSVVDAFLSPLKLAGAGVHGLEMRLAADAEVRRFGDDRVIEPLRQPATEWVSRRPGLQIEDKGLSLAIHYRACPEREGEVLAWTQYLAASLGGEVEIQRGKLVAEIRPVGPCKGDAALQLTRSPAFADRIPVFLGDDVTDEAAFESIQAIGGLGIRVGPAGVDTRARERLATPGDVRRMISSLVLHQPGFASFGPRVSIS